MFANCLIHSNIVNALYPYRMGEIEHDLTGKVNHDPQQPIFIIYQFWLQVVITSLDLEWY